MGERSKKLAFEFDQFESRPTPGKDNLPVWIDYIELICLFHKDRMISRGELRDIIFKEGNEVAPKTGENDELMMLMLGQEHNASEEDDSYFDVEVKFIDTATVDDKHALTIMDWFRSASSRSTAYGDQYPFHVDLENYVLRVKDEITDAQSLYIYLLLAGSLRLFSSKLITTITTDFEDVCLVAQGQMFPQYSTSLFSETHPFGKNQNGLDVYGTNLIEKFTWLANKINCDSLNTSFIKKNNSGDAGIDIISVFGFKDEVSSGCPLVLSQCACSYDKWKDKQADHSKGKLHHFNLLYYDYIRMIYIPFHYRDNDGAWYDIYRLETIVVDRFRIIKSMANALECVLGILKKWLQLVLLPIEQRLEYASSL